MTCVRLWLDTDIGANLDDAIALLLALAHPAVELVGVSTAGDAAEAGVAEARRLLDWAGGPRVPVRPGRAGEGLAGAIRASGAEEMVAIGPLTNLAGLLGRGGVTGLPLTVMGGALGPVRHRGELRSAESNFASDPSAAARVLAGWPGLTLVPLDVTAPMVLPDDQVRALSAAAPVLAGPLRAWSAEVVLHDPCALLVAVGEVGRSEHRRLKVTGDGRLVPAPDGTSVRVVVQADGARVGLRVLELIARRGGLRADRGTGLPG